MCLICLLATFRIGLRTPITVLRLDLNYTVVFNYTSNKLDPSVLSLFFLKKTTPFSNMDLLPGLNLELRSDVPVLIKQPDPGLNKYSTK